MSEPSELRNIEFDPYTEFFNCGNRVDQQLGDGTFDEDDPRDWYSWEAEECDYEIDDGFCVYKTAIVSVYGDSIKDRKFVVGWAELHE